MKYLTKSVLVAMLLCGGFSLHLQADESAQSILNKGNTLYEQGLFTEAVAEYTKAAQMGLAEAQFDLGYAYYNGEGAPKDYATAARWFKKAAYQNFPKADYNLAYCYMNGRGVPRDYDKALFYLTKSATSGYQQAQLTLSDCYANGVLVEQNEAESKKWKDMAEGKSQLPQQPPQSDAEYEREKAELAKLSQLDNPDVKADTPVTTPQADAPAVPVKSDTPAVPAAEDVISEGSPSDMVFDIQLDDSKPLVEKAPKAQKPKPQQQTPSQEQAQAPSQPQAPQNDSGAAPRPAIILTKDGIVKPKEETQADIAAADTTATAISKPPVLRILYPEDQSLFHTDIVKVKYQMMTHGYTGETRLVVLVDGVKQPESRAVRQANTVEVNVPNRDCTVMLYAQNKHGNSEPVSIRLIRENVAQVDLPKLFVVAVGVGKYDNEKLPNLRLTCKDAQDFANAVAKKKGLPFSDVQVKVLCDEEATRSDLFEAMEWMAQEASPGDLCIFFFAGHGYRDEKDRFYFMPYHGNIDQLYNCFSATDFKTAAEDINSKFVIFVDACYSGGLFSGTRSAAATHFVEQLRRTKNGMMLYASSASDTKSNEDPTWGNGAFTKALVEAFNGAVRQETDEGLSTQQLEMYLYKEVRKTTAFKQSPVFMNPNGMEHFYIFTYEN